MIRKIFLILGTFSGILIFFVGVGVLGYNALAQEPLVLENIQVDFTDKNVIVSWDANMSSSGRVDYAPATFYKEREEYQYFVQEGGSHSAHHVITLIGLQEDIKYHYRITSETKAQETATFDSTFETDKFEDNRVPIISNVSVVYASGRTATIQWRTDEGSGSEALFGKTENYGGRAGSGGLATEHDVTIRGLQPGTLYHFTVKSRDKDGNIAVYHDDTFRTQPTDRDDKENLAIFSLRPNAINDPNVKETTALITWRTSRPATGLVRLGTTPQKLSQSVNLPAPRTFLHSITLKNLAPAVTYYFQVESKDVLGKSAKGPVTSFVTRGEIPAQATLGGEGTDASVVLGDVFEETGSLPSGLLFYASFDNGFDADFSLGSRTATPIQVGRAKEGLRGSAADITQGGAVRYDTAKNFNPVEGTITFWFKPAWPNNKKFHQFFTLNDGPLQRRQFLFTFFKGVGNRLDFQLHDDRRQTYNYFAEGLENISLGEWHFAAISWKYNGGTAEIYFDDLDTLTRLSFGRGQTAKLLEKAPAFYENFFVGSTNQFQTNALIDEFAIFGRALTRQETRTVFQKGALYFLEGTSGQKSASPATGSDVSRQGQGVVLGVSTTPSPYTQARALYKAKDSPEVYAMVNGKKHYITSPSSFQLYGYQWRDVQVVSKKFLDSIPDARLLKTPESSTVYYMYQRPQVRWLKTPIPSPTVFVSYPKNFWGDIVVVNHLDVAAYPDAWLFKTDTSPVVYYLDRGNMRPFDSWEAFLQSRLNPYHIVGISEAHFAAYQKGETITAQNASEVASEVAAVVSRQPR